MASGGTLAAKGTVTNALSVGNGGTLSPGVNGTSTGILNTGNLSFGGSGTFTAQVNGEVAGTQADRLSVTGTVALGGATLSTSGAITSSAGQVITIITNDGADAISGTFAGLTEGASVVINSVTFMISYIGGTGNDVTLSQAFFPTTITVDLVAGALTIADTVSGGASALTLVRNGANVRIRMP